jgi:hypothetical protein
MDVACLGASFGESHFGSCSLGDARRTRRLVRTADLIMTHPGGTLPDNAAGRPRRRCERADTRRGWRLIGNQTPIAVKL